MFDEGFVNFDKKFINKKCVSGKLLLVMAYIRLNASYNGRISFSVDYLAESLGYKANRKPGKINENIVEALEWLRNNDYISYDIDLFNTKNHSKNFQCVINDDNNIFEIPKNEYDNISPFVQLKEPEFEKIIQSSFSRKDWLLSVFLHMKKRICINGVGQEAPYCFAALDTIAKDAGKNVAISRASVANVIEELVKCGLFCEHITGSYIDYKGKVKRAVNFYALSEEDMNHADCDELARWHIEEQEGIQVERFIKENNQRKDCS